MTSLWFGRKCSVGPRVDSDSYRKLGCFVEPSAFIREICDSLFRGKQTGGRNHGSYGMTRKNDLFSVPFCVLLGCQNLRDLIDPAGRHSAISKTFAISANQSSIVLVRAARSRYRLNHQQPDERAPLNAAWCGDQISPSIRSLTRSTWPQFGLSNSDSDSDRWQPALSKIRKVHRANILRPREDPQRCSDV
jgi:hypothetical protein